MMKKILFALLFLAGMFVITACTSEKTSDSYLSVSTTTLEFGSSGGEKNLDVSSNADWSISGIPNWITLSAVSGISSKQLTVTAKANTTGVLREGEFLVRSNDGSRQLTVAVKQQGDERGEGYLMVADVSKRWLGGEPLRPNSGDSIYVDANVEWTVEYPDWIILTASNKRVVKGTKIKGSAMLYFTAKEYIEDNDREGIISVSSTATRNTFDIPVAQLGWGHVALSNTLVMAHGIATGLKYGAGVTYMRYKLFEGTASDNELTNDEANGWGGYGYKLTETTWLSFGGRKANTKYELCIKTINAGNYYITDGLNRFSFTLPSDAYQPLADIVNVQLEDGKWKWTARMNEYAAGFYRFAGSDELINKSELHVAWNLRHRLTSNPSAYTLYTENMIYTLNSSANYCFATWAVGADGKLATVITKYDAVNESAARGFESHPEEEDYVGDWKLDEIQVKK